MAAAAEITIGIPVYNGEKYLPLLLAALKQQTYQNFVIVISDNASLDNTLAIANEAARLDPRISVHRNEQNIGGNLNFERVFSYCRTPYFIWLANDDLVDPEFLRTCLGGLTRDAGVVLSGCAATFIDATGAPLAFDQMRNCYLAPYFDTPLLSEKAHPGESSDPIERFHDFFPSYFASHIHGLLRASAVRKTRMLGSHMNGPALFLADLALQGRFVTSERQLFKRRYHQTCSEAMPWTERVSHTGNQSGRAAFLYNTRRFAGMVLRNEFLSPLQKARLVTAVIHHAIWSRYRQLIGIAKVKAKATLEQRGGVSSTT
jgi:glycosyltransferase involved in cell wall biosynthesis